ncbi:hypothetical protein SKB45_004402 [Salmonella enterica]|nr:hypothetical protein [Salmonella enterica]EAR5545551.1 hypothetical protein [Salmonella enterica]EAT3229564.1 hypothetical protein [Salmonella enterica]EBF2167730.1 hypothetical protein [Salmonella enterica]EBI4450099.1 hypothetical protein [Salmonella enterica]
MAKRSSGRIDPAYIGTMQKCYAAKGETFSTDLSREVVIGDMRFIDEVWANRAVRRRIKALERGKR